MAEVFDIVVLFQELGKFSKGMSKSELLTASSAVLYKEINVRIEKRSRLREKFESKWSSEINNNGEMTLDTASKILSRGMDFPEKYYLYAGYTKLKEDDINYFCEQYITNFIDHKFVEAIKEILDGCSNIPQKIIKQINDNASEPGIFFASVLLATIEYGCKVKQAKAIVKTETNGGKRSDIPLLQTKSSINIIWVTNNPVLSVIPDKEPEKYSKYCTKTYTNENPPDYIKFNSITNNPSFGGDERNFVGIREFNTRNKWTNEMTIEKDKIYTVRMYVHNNAADNLNLVATNVKAMFNVPRNTDKSINVSGILTSSNALPNRIWDHAKFVSNTEFNLRYLAGSAHFENNAFSPFGVELPDSIVTNKAALLGYSKLDGNFPSGYQHHGYVTIKIKPQFAQSPTYLIHKSARLHQSIDKEFKEKLSVKAGDIVEYQIHFKNIGSTKMNNVMIGDVINEQMNYITGSTRLYNTSNPKGMQTSDNIFISGLNIGDYHSNGDGYVRYLAKVSDDIDPYKWSKIWGWLFI